jgi:hypothetical protein
MAEPSRITNETHFAADVAFLADVTFPDSIVDDDSIESGANIAYSKLQHSFPLVYSQPNGTAVVAETRMLHVAKGDGALLSVEAAVTTVATGADRTVTVDVQKSTGGGAFATMLSATIVLDDDSVAFTPEAATVSGTNTYSDGDILQVVVTVAGSADAQAQGLVVTTFVYEEST